jgi:hypothetical protein
MAVACTHCRDTGFIIFVNPTSRGKSRKTKKKCKDCNGPTPKDK